MRSGDCPRSNDAATKLKGDKAYKLTPHQRSWCLRPFTHRKWSSSPLVVFHVSAESRLSARDRDVYDWWRHFEAVLRLRDRRWLGQRCLNATCRCRSRSRTMKGARLREDRLCAAKLPYLTMPSRSLRGTVTTVRAPEGFDRGLFLDVGVAGPYRGS